MEKVVSEINSWMIEGNNGDQLNIATTGEDTFTFSLISADETARREITKNEAWEWYVRHEMPTPFRKFVHK